MVETKYYVRRIKGVLVEVKDIVNAWDLGPWEAQAIQYLLRAKYKQDELSDLKKAADMVAYAVEKKEGMMYDGGGSESCKT